MWSAGTLASDPAFPGGGAGGTLRAARRAPAAAPGGGMQGDPIPGSTEVPGNFTNLENANNSLNSWAASQPASTQEAVQAFDSAFGPNGSYNDHGLPYAQEGDTNSGWGTSLSGKTTRGGGGGAGAQPGGLFSGYTNLGPSTPGAYTSAAPTGSAIPGSTTQTLNGWGNSGEAAGMMKKGGAVKAFADGGDASDPSVQPVAPPAYDDGGGVIPDGDGDADDQGMNAQAGDQSGADMANQLNQSGDQGMNAQAGAAVDWDAVQNIYNNVRSQHGLPPSQSGGFAASASQMRPSTNVEDDRQGQMYPSTASKIIGQGEMNAKNNLDGTTLEDSTTVAPVAPNEGGDMGPAPSNEMPKLPPNMVEGSLPAGNTQVAMQNPEDYRQNMQEPANQKNEAGFSPGSYAEAQNSRKGGSIRGVIPE